VSTLLIVSAITLILSAAVSFFRTELSALRNNSVAGATLKSPFDVPSIFKNNQRGNQIYSGWNVAGVTEERYSAAGPLTCDSTELKNISMTISNREHTKFRYTHITERMTLVNTH